MENLINPRIVNSGTDTTKFVLAVREITKNGKVTGRVKYFEKWVFNPNSKKNIAILTNNVNEAAIYSTYRYLIDKWRLEENEKLAVKLIEIRIKIEKEW